MIVIFSENKKERSLKTSFLMYKLSSDFTCQALQKSCFFSIKWNKQIHQTTQTETRSFLASKQAVMYKTIQVKK